MRVTPVLFGAILLFFRAGGAVLKNTAESKSDSKSTIEIAAGKAITAKSGGGGESTTSSAAAAASESESESESESDALGEKTETEDVDKRIAAKTKEIKKDYEDLGKLYEERNQKMAKGKGPHAALISNICTLIVIIIIIVVWYFVCCRHGRCCCLCCYNCRDDKRCCCSCCCKSPLTDDEEEEAIVKGDEGNYDTVDKEESK